MEKFSRAQRASTLRQNRFARAKVLPRLFAVDGDAAIAVGEEAHAGHCRLAPSHTIVILTFDGIGQGRYSSPLVTLLEQPLLAVASTMILGLSRGLASGLGGDVLVLHKF